MDKYKNNIKILLRHPHHLFILLLFVLFLPDNGVEGQLPEGFSDPSKLLENTSFRSDTLKGLNEATDIYVGAISKKQFGPVFLKEIGIDTNNISLAQVTNFNLASLTNTTVILSAITKVVTESPSYVVHVIIGLVLFVSLLLCSFLLCCCRSKGCFCGKTGKGKKKGSDKVIIVVLFLLLLAITVVAFLDGFGVSVTASEFSKNFETKNGTNNTLLLANALTIIDRSLEYVNFLKNETLKLLDKNEIKTRVNSVVKSVSGAILESLTSSTGDFFRSLNELTRSLNILKTQLNTTVRLIDSLKISYGQLKDFQSDISTKGTDELDSCKNFSPCKEAYNAYRNFTVLRDESFLTVPGLSDLQDAVNSFTSGPIGQALLLGPDGIFSDITSQLGNISDLVNSYVDDVANTINQDLPFSSESIRSDATFVLINGYFNQASPILNIVVPILASIIFMMVAMNLLGMLMVVFCGSNKPAIPEKILIGSSGSSFPTGSIFALLAAVLFLATCPLYGEFCLDIYSGNESTYLKVADDLVRDVVRESLKDNSVIKEFEININYNNINILRNGVFGYCVNNQSLTNVFFDFVTLDRTTTDNFIVRVAQPQLDKVLPNIANIGQSQIFSPSTFQTINDTIDALAAITLPSLNLFSNVSAKTTLPTIPFMKDLTNQAVQDGTKKAELNSLLSQMDTLSTSVMAEEAQLIKSFANISETLQGSVTTPSIAYLLRNLTTNLLTLKNSLSSDSDFILKIKNASLDSMKDELYTLVVEYKHKFLGSFQCRPVYDLFTSIIFIPCRSILRPLNALWLCIGAYTVLVIGSAVCGLWMGGLLVRQKKKENEVGMMDDAEEMQIMEEQAREKREKRRDGRRGEEMDDRRNRRNRRVNPANGVGPNTPLPVPPQYDDPYYPPSRGGLVPPISVFPNGLDLNISPQVQASNPMMRDNAKIYLPRQPFTDAPAANAYNRKARGNRGDGNMSPSFLPPFDPFTNYQRM